jgi:formylmethanofuran dehydrogenase subunit E
MFEVGQAVRVKPSITVALSCRVGVCREMTEFCGQIAKITSSWNDGDGENPAWRYKLDLDRGRWIWEDILFEVVEGDGMNWKCDQCGAVLEYGIDEQYDVEGSHICENCFNENYFFCEECGRTEKIENGTMTENGMMCSRCFDRHYATCADCGEVFRKYDGYHINNGDRWVCGVCYEDNYFTCDQCGNIFSNDECHSVDCGYICDSCFETYDIIGDYHHTQVDKFFSLPEEISPVKFIGIELEVEAKRGDRYDGARNVLECLGRNFIECKHDGSLSNGFEIVTQPATLQYHYSVDYDRAFKRLISDGMRSHNPGSCGLHFHVSRNFFGTGEKQFENIAKMIVMLDYMWEDIVKFSRRDYNDLDQWAKKNKVSATKRVDDTIELNEYDRYQAINIKNRSTIEFRFMRGTLRTNTFLASLEWIDMFTNYAISHTMEQCFKATWKKVFRGSSKNFKEYCLSQKIGVPEYDHDVNEGEN